MNILGVSALYHDSAAALIKDGEIIAAAQEERFTRKKHDAGLPQKAIAYCLRAGEIEAADIDYVVYYDDPLLTLDRYMKNVLFMGRKCGDLLENGYSKLFGAKLWIREMLRECVPSIGNGTGFMVAKHHISHAASAFYPSTYDKAAILTVDGVGEWTTLAIGIGDGNHIELREELRYPHSLGLLYSAFTYFCGFKVNSGDYKFMGLAPYGEPVYEELLYREIINVKEDGSFRLNLDYFDFYKGRTMINEDRLAKLFGGGRRLPESRITKREMDIAASVQKVTEDILLKIIRYAKDKYGNNIPNLVMAGGVALNCVANGKLMESGIFENIWVQPAAGDAGGALGAALYTYYEVLGKPRNTDGVHDCMKGTYLGPQYSTDEIKAFLIKENIRYHTPVSGVASEVAALLDEQKVIGILSGRMEFGPRALGNRSIIADPRSENMQEKMNLKIKYRESFRPFAPAVLRQRASEYFNMDYDSPYMLFCAEVKDKDRDKWDVHKTLKSSDYDMLEVIRGKRSDIPAVTHVDYSARVQTVDGEENSEFYAIIKEFEKRTGCGVLINTSFNVRGEPIVCSPKDAYTCFMRSDMDALVLGDFIVFKNEQNPLNDGTNWRKEYELD